MLSPAPGSGALCLGEQEGKGAPFETGGLTVWQYLLLPLTAVWQLVTNLPTTAVKQWTPQRWLFQHFPGSLSAICTCSGKFSGQQCSSSPSVGSGEQGGIRGHIIVASSYNSCSELCLPTDISFRCFFINPITSYVFQSPWLILLFCSHKAATHTGLLISYKVWRVWKMFKIMRLLQ